MATGSTGVYGGVDYNAADAATKKRLLAQAQQLKTDSSFKDSETTRALQAIRDREAAGLDTSAQRKYLTSNLGYTGNAAAPTKTAGGVTAALAGVPGGTLSSSASATPAASATGTKTTSQSGELMDLMRQYATKQATPFSYDANSDPAYQAALARARANIQTGNAQVQADTNRRGILNSTITTDRGSEIAAQEMGNVETTVLPQLMQAAYQRYADQQAQEQQQFANQGNLAQMLISEDQRGIDNTNTRAGLTGYLPGDDQAQQLYSQLISLKQQAEATGITAADRAKLSNQADGIRARLSSMGVDISKLGADSSSSTAGLYTPTVRTLQGQQLDQQAAQQQWENRFNYGQAIGQFANGQKTLQAQQMDTSNQQYAEQFAYQKARDAITDQRWQTEFDENVRQYGLSFGLQQLSQSDDQAYRQAQLALSQDDNLRAWLATGETPASEYNGMTANQIYDVVSKAFTKPVLDKDGDPIAGQSALAKDDASKEQMYQQVMGAGLPDGQDTQVLSLLGLTQADITKYDKKYGVSSGN